MSQSQASSTKSHMLAAPVPRKLERHQSVTETARCPLSPHEVYRAACDPRRQHVYRNAPPRPSPQQSDGTSATYVNSDPQPTDTPVTYIASSPQTSCGQSYTQTISQLRNPKQSLNQPRHSASHTSSEQSRRSSLCAQPSSQHSYSSTLYAPSSSSGHTFYYHSTPYTTPSRGSCRSSLTHISTEQQQRTPSAAPYAPRPQQLSSNGSPQTRRPVQQQHSPSSGPFQDFILPPPAGFAAAARANHQIHREWSHSPRSTSSSSSAPSIAASSSISNVNRHHRHCRGSRDQHHGSHDQQHDQQHQQPQNYDHHDRHEQHHEHPPHDSHDRHEHRQNHNRSRSRSRRGDRGDKRASFHQDAHRKNKKHAHSDDDSSGSEDAVAAAGKDVRSKRQRERERIEREKMDENRMDRKYDSWPAMLDLAAFFATYILT